MGMAGRGEGISGDHGRRRGLLNKWLTGDGGAGSISGCRIRDTRHGIRVQAIRFGNRVADPAWLTPAIPVIPS